MAEITLYIQHNGLLLVPSGCKEKKCSRFFSWLNSEEKWQEALSTLTEKDQIFLTIDMVEEDIDFVWRPKLFPWEKRSFLKMEAQRIEQEHILLYKVAWTGVVRKQEGRKEELVSKFLVHQNPYLQAVLDYIEAHRLRLKGIYSITYLIQDLLNRVARSKVSLSHKQKKQPFFMIVRLSRYRFRQLFFLENQARISREILVDEHLENEMSIQAAVIVETKAALKYLYNQKILPYNTPVSLLVIDHCDQGVSSWREVVYQDFIQSHWTEEALWFYKETSFEALFKRWRIPPEQIEGRFILAHYVQRYKIATFYQTPYLQKTLFYTNLSAALVAFNLFVVALFAFILAYEGITAYLTQQKIAHYQHTLSLFHQEKKKLQQLVKLQYDAKDLKASVDFSESLLQVKGREPAGVDFVPLSQILKKSPHLQLQSLSWKKPQKLDDERYELILEGWVYPFEGQYGPLVMWVDTFIQQLAKVPGYQKVTLTKAPLNRDVTQVLTIDSSKTSVKALPFEIHLQAKVSPYGK